jgi:hypothetical protein
MLYYALLRYGRRHSVSAWLLYEQLTYILALSLLYCLTISRTAEKAGSERYPALMRNMPKFYENPTTALP